MKKIKFKKDVKFSVLNFYEKICLFGLYIGNNYLVNDFIKLRNFFNDNKIKVLSRSHRFGNLLSIFSSNMRILKQFYNNKKIK